MAGNEFLNTFQNGMNQDSNLVYQPDGTYRYAKNLQLINHDGNNFTLKDSLGNRKIFELPPTWNSGSPGYGTATRMPIGFISFADGEQQLVVFSAHDTGVNGSYGEIGLLSLTNIGQSVEGDAYSQLGTTPLYDGYLPLYGHSDLKFSRMYKIEGFAFAENDNIRRVYWTDYFNEPRVLDIANSIFTTYYANGAPPGPTQLVPGTQYMVLNGIINYNGTEYGPGIGNVFTAVTGVFNWAVMTVTPYTPLVIEYYDISLLNWQPDRLLGNMNFDSFGTGNCNCGNRMYFYRLKSSAAGVATSWSYGMYPVHVGKDQSPVPWLNSQHYYVGAGTSSTLVDSGKSVKIDIDNIDTTYDTIELAVIEFDQALEIPYNSPRIVVQQTITGSQMTLEDFGNTNLGDLTLDDITLFPATILKCKTITTNKNYNVIANIVEREEFADFDTTGIVLDDYIYDMGVDNRCDICGTQMTFGMSGTGVNPSPTTNPPLVGGIEDGTRWLVVRGGTVEYPVASGNIYNVGEVFIGVSGFKNYTIASGAPIVRGAVSINRYDPQNNSNLRQNNVELKTYAGWDYRNPAVASMAKGYWSSEKYRFGILFYDKKGNPFYVRWIGDHTFDSIYAKGGLMKNKGVGTDWWSLQANLLSVSNLRIPESIYTQISGFSIVRAERDPVIITQGLCWQTQVETTSTPFKIHPLPSLTLTDGNGHSADPTDHVYSYICPDDLVGETFTRSKLMNVGDTMRVASWLEPYRYGGDYYKFYGWIDEWASKLYGPIAATNPNYNNESTVLTWARIGVHDTVTGFVSGNDFVNYDSWIGVSGAGYNVDNSCISAPPTSDVNDRALVGGDKIIVKTVNDFDIYDQAAGTKYSDPDTGGPNENNPFKCLVNYVIPNSNQYGGTGEAAKAATLYMSTGHFQPIDATVIADNLTVISGENFLVFDNIQVAGGDCFLCLVDHGYGLYDSNYGPGNPFPATVGGGSYAIMFPCECNANFNLRRGRKTSDYGMHNEVASNGVSYDPFQLEDYQYNNGYTSEGTAIKYPALPLNFNGTDRFPYRIRWAGQKLSGEQIDTFRTFYTNDYRDVDGRYGEINNVRPKGDYVYYWQNKAVGSVPILERQLISASAGASTTLGTGGVITRFDTISPKFGNQHQHGLTDTSEGWIWFDMRNKDVCVMSLNGGVAEITVPTGMKSFFSEIFLERLTIIYNDVYLNSQTSDISSDRPLIGTGIVGVYDPKNKMSYLTFKFRSYFKDREEPILPEQYQILSKDFTIAYSHVLNKFVAFYDKTPALWHNHNQSILSANNPKNLNKYYASDMVVPTDLSKGDVIMSTNGDAEYVLLNNLTVSVFPINPFSTDIQLINTPNQIYIENEIKDMGFATIVTGYEYNFEYGRVVDNELEVVVSPKQGQMSVTNCELGSEGDCFTEVTISADNNQTATDTNINSTNRNYRYFDGSWWFNLPLSRLKGRITDKYLKLRFKKKNWSSSPITNDNKLTVWEFLRSFIENKR